MRVWEVEIWPVGGLAWDRATAWDQTPCNDICFEENKLSLFGCFWMFLAMSLDVLGLSYFQPVFQTSDPVLDGFCTPDVFPARHPWPSFFWMVQPILQKLFSCSPRLGPAGWRCVDRSVGVACLMWRLQPWFTNSPINLNVSYIRAIMFNF